MKIVPVVRKAYLKKIDEEQEDINFWLSKSPAERVAAVTNLIKLSLSAGQRMDKSAVSKRMMHS